MTDDSSPRRYNPPPWIGDDPDKLRSFYAAAAREEAARDTQETRRNRGIRGLIGRARARNAQKTADRSMQGFDFGPAGHPSRTIDAEPVDQPDPQSIPRALPGDVEVDGPSSESGDQHQWSERVYLPEAASVFADPAVQELLARVNRAYTLDAIADPEIAYTLEDDPQVHADLQRLDDLEGPDAALHQAYVDKLAATITDRAHRDDHPITAHAGTITDPGRPPHPGITYTATGYDHTYTAEGVAGLLYREAAAEIAATQTPLTDQPQQSDAREQEHGQDQPDEPAPAAADLSQALHHDDDLKAARRATLEKHYEEAIQQAKADALATGFTSPTITPTNTELQHTHPSPELKRVAPEDRSFEGFNFWRDVIGDDLIVDGVAYSHHEWEHDGEGGVQRISAETLEYRRQQEVNDANAEAEQEQLERDVHQPNEQAITGPAQDGAREEHSRDTLADSSDEPPAPAYADQVAESPAGAEPSETARDHQDRGEDLGAVLRRAHEATQRTLAARAVHQSDTSSAYEPPEAGGREIS